MPDHPVGPTCPECGSNEVHYRGVAEWDVELQEWVLYDLDDDREGYCLDCGEHFAEPKWENV